MTATTRAERRASAAPTAPHARAVHDRFDEIPEGARVGAHRASPSHRGAWVAFAWAALACGILVGGGVLGLHVLTSTGTTVVPATGGTTAEKTAAPVTDPSSVPASLNLEITVLNASPSDDADQKVAAALKAKGWPVSGSADASARDEKTTVVYYSARDYEGIARGLVKELGVGQVQLSDAISGTPVTVVVGADYKG